MCDIRPKAWGYRSVAFSFEQLVKALGEPVRADSSVVHPRGARGGLGQREPIITPNAYLHFACGCKAEIGFASSYQLRPCETHIRGVET